MTARDYNAAQVATGTLTADHVTELVRYWQAGHDLAADGMAGPRTIASFAPSAPQELSVIDHWLIGPGVTRIAAHPTWYGRQRGSPQGIVAHYTATDPGTSTVMAQRRVRSFGHFADRATSWHLTIETDGSIIAMVPLDHVAWHAASGTAIAIPGLGPANPNTIGIEMVGHGREFPAAQVDAACAVWRALVHAYRIPRQYAMITHQSIDPTRRKDPGPVWMTEHAPTVLEYAYGSG